jgi:anti-anti-sigma regulatory factor
VLHPAAEQLTVDVVGDLEGRTLRDLVAIVSCAAGGSRVVDLDLGQAAYIGVEAIDALAAVAADADRRGSHIAVVRASEPARRALTDAGLGSMLVGAPTPAVVEVAATPDGTLKPSPAG